MKRRDFVKKIGSAAAGSLVVPYILPSGRVFAKTGMRKVNHVVFCLFAGGVRILESLQKSEGNLMPNLIAGTEPISPDLLGSISQLPPAFATPLEQFGTVYKEFRFKQGPTGHYNAHATAITGVYNNADVNIQQRPSSPTVFEFYRKHNTPVGSATNAWWVSDALGPYPALNYSDYPGYGAMYGANFIQPTSIISQSGFNSLGTPKVFDTEEQTKIANMQEFLDGNFSSQFQAGDAGVTNSSEETLQIENFVARLFSEAIQGQHNNPWNIPSGFMSSDMYNIFYAEKVIEEFKPELLVVNMQDVDICHQNFSGYCNNLRMADYALAHLWDFIQNTPGMADDTILIAAPEHGRNLETNTVMDANGRFAIDHTNDEMSRRIFCAILGPNGIVNQNSAINEELGESIDIVPTIANVLGFDTEMPPILPGNVLEEALI